MAKRKRGRPTIYTPELAERICRELAEGKSLRAVCEPEDMPVESTVRAWAVKDYEGFYAQYAQAMEIRADRWAEEILEIADDGRNDTYLDDKGNPRLDFDNVQRSKLRVDARKWVVSRILPNRFGDRTKVEHSGRVGFDPSSLTEDQLRAVIATGQPPKDASD